MILLSVKKWHEDVKMEESQKAGAEQACCISGKKYFYLHFLEVSDKEKQRFLN